MPEPSQGRKKVAVIVNPWIWAAGSRLTNLPHIKERKNLSTWNLSWSLHSLWKFSSHSHSAWAHGMEDISFQFDGFSDPRITRKEQIMNIFEPPPFLESSDWSLGALGPHVPLRSWYISQRDLPMSRREMLNKTLTYTTLIHQITGMDKIWKHPPKWQDGMLSNWKGIHHRFYGSPWSKPRPLWFFGIGCVSKWFDDPTKICLKWLIWVGTNLLYIYIYVNATSDAHNICIWLYNCISAHFY